MALIKISKRNLEKLLEDFAHDLANHVIQIKNNRVSIPPNGLKRLIKDYSTL
jgi:hypothetical protein